ncbi:MAG: choice-of-anchor D domain-containing protein [Deltaproteobacteria bacterium]|nr:choice-of-anchor D domain-containing protein [Deltaproteobacteria bacterium]
MLGRSSRIQQLLWGILTVLLCSGPVLDCECDEQIGGRPELEVDKTALQFDQVAVGYPQTRSLVVSNAGRVGLTLDQLGVRGDPSPFELLGMLDPESGEIVEAAGVVGLGGSIELVVQYSPATEDASDFDILEIITNDRDDCPSDFNQCEIQLSGTGAPPNAELEVVCQQDESCPGSGTPVCQIVRDVATNEHPVRVSLNFCDISPGHNRELNALLRNAGNIPLNMRGFVFDERFDSTDFRMLEPAEEDIALEPGEDQMFSLLYAPTETGFDNTGMDLETDDADLVQTGYPDGTFSIRALANAASPDIQVNPEQIPFTGVVQGEQATEEVSINNRGTAVLVIEGLEVTGGTVAGEFSIDRSDGFEIDIGGQETLSVTYAPVDSGQDDGSVIIYSNDPDSPRVVVELGGAVRPDLDVSPPDLVEFIGVEQGASAQQDVTLRNVGYADLTVSAIAFSSNPGDPPVFELLGLPGDFPTNPLVMSPGESTVFTIKFTDNTAIRDEVGQLDIAHDSPNDSNPYVLLAISSGTPTNMPPVAIVDPPSQVINGMETVYLDGTQSFDPDAGDSVATYSWSFLFKPQTPQGDPSLAVLSSSEGPTTSFVPDLVGTYVVRLVVFDTYNAMSQPADASISVNP